MEVQVSQSYFPEKPSTSGTEYGWVQEMSISFLVSMTFKHLADLWSEKNEIKEPNLIHG